MTILVNFTHTRILEIIPNPFRKTFNDEGKDVWKAREERTRLEELGSRRS